MNLINYLKKTFFNNLDKERLTFLLKRCFIIIFFCFAFNFIGIGLSKYESNATSEANAAVAFFLIQEGTYEKKLPLGKITPSSEKYVYPFTISNYKDNKITDVAMEYTVSFITTTNLPLTYEIYKNETYSNNNATNLILNQEVYQDEQGVYYNKITLDDIGTFSFNENQTDIFNLVVGFDDEYKNSPIDYSGYIEMVKVIVDAKQKISEGE